MNSRLIMRLIDVALIILMGFISISRLKTEYVDLPSGGNGEAAQFKTHESRLRIYRNYFVFVDSGASRRFKSLPELEQSLVRYQQNYSRQKTRLVLIIEPQKSSLMQGLIDVLDICQRNHIDKNLSYD